MRTPDETKKIEAIQYMLDYLSKTPDLPVPSTIYTWGISVDGYVSTSSYSLNVFQGDEETPSDFRERVKVAMRAWISDVAKAAYNSRSVQRPKIVKKYDDDKYSLTLKTPYWELVYRCDRDAVCKRIVKGTKVIPAHTVPEQEIPERVEEDVEWVCDDVSLMKDDEE